MTVERSGVNQVHALCVPFIPSGQAATLRQQDAIVRKSHFAGSVSDKGRSAVQAKRPAGVGRCGTMSGAVGGQLHAVLGAFF